MFEKTKFKTNIKNQKSNKMKQLNNKFRKIFFGLLSFLGFAGIASAQCGPGEVAVTIDVTTDQWGYELYWELAPTGTACGTGAIFTGGNPGVGCLGGGAQSAGPGAGYASSSTTTEGPFCLIPGQSYDIIAIDDWGDGGHSFEVSGGSTYTMGATSASDIFTFTAQFPPDHNLQVKEVYFSQTMDSLGNLLGELDSNSTVYYGQIPVRQAVRDSLYFGASAKNAGNSVQSNVTLTSTVNDGTNNVFFQTLNNGNVAVGVTDSFLITTPYTPVTKGSYTVTFDVNGDSTDATPTDNSVSRLIEVGDTVYAFDDNNLTGANFFWYGAGVTYEIGNSYFIHVDDTATSISYYNFNYPSAGIGMAGNVISLNLYDVNGFDTFTPIASAAFHTITTAEENNWITLQIPETPMPRGWYFAMVETYSDQTFATSNQDGPAQRSFVDPDNSGSTWYYTTSIPWVRLNTKMPPACTLSASGASTDLNCSGDNSGTAAVTPTGGTAPFTYQWNDPGNSTTDSIGGLAGGSYSVIVTDATGCQYQLAYNIVEPAPITIHMVTNNISCNGGTDGSISANVAGGTAPFTYTWSDTTLTGASPSGLSAGTYGVTVSDANGCPSGSGSTTITEPGAIALTFSQVTANCNVNGEASVAVTGGTAPYAYAWSNGQSTATATGLTGGAYSVTVTDSIGCSAILTDTVLSTDPVSISVALSSPSACGVSDGSASVTIATGSSPFAYQWSTGATTTTGSLSGLAAGSYTVTVTDFNLCADTVSFTLVDSLAPTLNISSTDVNCLGGSDGEATVTAFGGTPAYTYLWNDAGAQTTATAAGLVAGTYEVTVTDNAGCSGLLSTTINEPSTAVAVDSVSSTNITCNGSADGTGMAYASGGTGSISYSWSSGSSNASASGLAAGTYTVVATDANGCTASDSITVTEPTALAVSATSTNITCHGAADGAVDLTVAGGTAPYNYAWDNSASTEDLTGLSAGNYQVTVTDAGGCTGNAFASITEPTALSVSSGTVTDVSVAGGADGAIDMTVSGGTAPYVYSWSNSATTEDISNLAAGNYTLTVTDANGCTATQVVTVADGAVAISETISEAVFNVFPNPNNGKFSIMANNLPNEECLIEVRNVIGQLIYSETLSENTVTFNKEISLSNKERGVYFIGLISESGSRTEKLVVY